MGTDNGLSRFDGKEFINYQKAEGLPDNKINAILTDRDGNLWIGSNKGCIIGSFDNMANPIWQVIFPTKIINAIVEDGDGKLWFNTFSGLSCLDGKVVRHFTASSGLPSEEIFTLTADKEGKLLIGTYKGLYYYKNEKFIPFIAAAGLKDQYISTLLSDSGGNLWIGTQKGLYCIREGKMVLYTIKEGLCDNHVTALKEDRGGNIWIGTWNGASFFSSGKFTNYTTTNGLPHNFIYSIAQDHEDNMWFGTHGGASCLDTSNVKIYTKDHGLPTGIIEDVIRDKKDSYWFATPEGLSCYSGDHFINYTKKNGLICDTINGLMADRHGNIWIATIEGLSIFSSGSFSNYTEKDGLASKILFKFIETRDGTIWIGSNNGLTCSRNGKFSPPPFSLEEGKVLCFMEDSKGNLWFSSWEKLNQYSQNRLTTFTTQDGLPGTKIEAIFEDSKGKIWICSVGGLTDYNKGKFTHYSKGNSDIPDNACYCIVEDTNGNLWIGNSNGLTCFDGKRFKYYPSEKLALTGRKWSSGIKDNRGNLWFGTTEGVVTFYPPPVTLNSTPPPVYFTGLKVMEKDIPRTAPNSFNYDRNIFRFNFLGLSYNDPAGISYKYCLENIDKNWQTTKDRSRFYPFLPPGAYTFKVKAINSDGVESVKPAEYTFVIRPPFWKTWWFLILSGLLLNMFLLLVIQWRIRRAKEKAELKARGIELEARNRQLVTSQRMELMGTLAAGTVHDLKNLLSVIIGYSRLMAQKYRGDSEDNQNIEIIKDTAATAVQMAKQILSFARHKTPADETVDLGIELTEILDTLKITQPKNIQVKRQLPPEAILLPLNPARFQQIIMNLCLNAFQAMPNGGQLTITLSSTPGNEIALEISDTGAGIENENLDKIFDPFFTTKEKNQGSGLGLFVVKQIVSEYNGKIEVYSQPGKGTTFVIRFPLFIN